MGPCAPIFIAEPTPVTCIFQAPTPAPTPRRYMQEFVLFSGPSCPGCKHIKDALTRTNLIDKLRLIDLSTDEGLEEAKLRNVRTIPMILNIKDGKVWDELRGSKHSDIAIKVFLSTEEGNK